MSIYELAMEHSNASPLVMVTFVFGWILALVSILVVVLLRKSKRNERDTRWQDLIRQLEQKAAEKAAVQHNEEVSRSPYPVQSRQNIFAIGLASPKRNVNDTDISIRDLLSIEDALIGLRELYERRLIDARVYVEESMKHSAKLHGVMHV